MAWAPARAADCASSVARTSAARPSPPSMTSPATSMRAPTMTTMKAVTWPRSSCRRPPAVPVAAVPYAVLDGERGHEPTLRY